MSLRTLINHDRNGLIALAKGRPPYQGMITCVKAFGEVLSACDMGEVIDDLLAVKVLGGYATNDMTGVEIILSDVDPSGWTADDLQNHVIQGIWRFPVLVRSASSKAIRPKIPEPGGWRYLVFFTNPDAQATGDADLSVAVMRSRKPGYAVLNSVAI